MIPDRAIQVLCVDDNPDLCLLVEKRVNIEPDMDSVGRVHDLDHLVEAVRQNEPDVVILDLTMLGRDSLEFIPILQASCPRARVVIYSGFDQDEAVQRARAAGAWGFLSKCDEADELLQAIRRVAAGEPVFPEN